MLDDGVRARASRGVENRDAITRSLAVIDDR